MAASAALIAALSACSSADNTAACKELSTTLVNVTKQGVKQITDPTGLEKTYADGAASMRRIAGDQADGDVQSTAKKLADSLEKLGHETAAFASGSATSTDMPNTDALTSATDELEKACN